MTIAFRCVCGHTPFAHIEYVGNCRECPMTTSGFKLKTGKLLQEPHCTKYKDQSLYQKQHKIGKRKYHFFDAA